MAFDGKYLDWNQKRIKGIIDFYGHQFMYQKSVLDLGCGHADISGVLYRLGADVTAVDVRQEHLKMANKKFPGLKTVRADLDRAWPFYGKFFDIILDLDLICHLSDYESHLKAACGSTNYIIIETAVCDSNDPYKSVMISENKNIYDLSANGVSCRPSPAAIERILKECGMSFKRQDHSRYNSGSYVYDWKEKNNNECDVNKRRIWFAYKPANMIAQERPKPVVNIVSNFPGEVLENSQIPVLYSPPMNNATTVPLVLRNENIRTAVCISGHLRTFDSNFRSLYDNILSQMNCDIFVHTWDTLGLSYRHTDANLYAKDTNNLIDKIIDLYHPKKLIIEQTRPFKVTPLMQKRLIDHRDINGILSMLYKIEACNNLKKDYENENGFKYDCVIRFRGDIWVEQIIPIDVNTKLNSLFLPAYGNFAGLCDQFAYGDSEVMDKYSSLYSNLESYLQMGAPMHPEKLIQYHVNASRLPVTKVNFKYVIKRANGLIQDNMLLERAQGFLR